MSIQMNLKRRPMIPNQNPVLNGLPTTWSMEQSPSKPVEPIYVYPNELKRKPTHAVGLRRMRCAPGASRPVQREELTWVGRSSRAFSAARVISWRRRVVFQGFWPSATVWFGGLFSFGKRPLSRINLLESRGFDTAK